MHLGGKARTIDLGGLQVLNFGTDRDRRSLPVTRVAHDGQAPDAPWRKAAADANLIAMTRERFENVSARWPDQSDDLTWDDVLEYRAVLAANFNEVVLENDLKIGVWVIEQKNDGPRFRRGWTDAALAWPADPGRARRPSR